MASSVIRKRNARQGKVILIIFGKIEHASHAKFLWWLEGKASRRIVKHAFGFTLLHWMVNSPTDPFFVTRTLNMHYHQTLKLPADVAHRPLGHSLEHSLS